jgi:hypothetical protein
MEEEANEIGDGYKSEDELEDFISGIDTNSLFSGGGNDQMIVKFNLHRKLKDMLDNDLNDKMVKKLVNGDNTYCFGDNRYGKCGIGSDVNFVNEP